MGFEDLKPKNGHSPEICEICLYQVRLSTKSLNQDLSDKRNSVKDLNLELLHFENS